MHRDHLTNDESSMSGIKVDGLDDGVQKLGAVLLDKFSKTTIDRALRLATSQTRTDIKKRVFNEQGATLADGRSAGTYEENYLIRREELYKRRNTNINFIATDSMNRSFQFERKAYNSYVLGLNEVGNKTEVTNGNKYKYLSERFGNFLSLSQEEITNFYKVFTTELFKKR